MIDPEQFKTAMWRLGAAVNIITTDGKAGRHGMTASAVCRVSDDPGAAAGLREPLLPMNAILVENGQLCINVLAAEQEALSGRFASRGLNSDERFAAGSWDILENGVPALAGALCNFGCHIASVSEVGTHSVLFCHVDELRMGESSDGLVHFGRSYHRLPMQAAL